MNKDKTLIIDFADIYDGTNLRGKEVLCGKEIETLFLPAFLIGTDYEYADWYCNIASCAKKLKVYFYDTKEHLQVIV